MVNKYVNIQLMRVIDFYRDINGIAPVESFLDNQNPKVAQKITWVLKLIQEHDIVPVTYFKKLKSKDDIWEIRIKHGTNIFRILCFQKGNKVIILTNGFQKKTQKTPNAEISLAIKRKKDWLRRNK